MRPETNAKTLFFILGLGSVLVQIILIRRLLSTFHGNELTMGAVLAGWMVWTGSASLLTGRLTDKLAHGRSWLARSYILAALLLSATVLFAPAVKPFLGQARAEIIGPQVILLGSFFITAPICAILGLSFNLCCQVTADEKGAVARVYLWEALGAGLGGLFFSMVLAGKSCVFAQSYLVMALFFYGAFMAVPRKKQAWALALAAILTAAFFIDPQAGLPA